MQNTLEAYLQKALAQQKEEHLFRQYNAREGASTATSRYKGQEYLSFISNDYLGLSSHPALIKAAQEAAATYGIGSTAAHSVGGHCDVHDELERAVAEFTGRPAALVFSTGYMANLGIISSLIGPKDIAFVDRLVHASLLDGVRLSRVSFARYQHNNMTQLASKMDRYKAEHSLIITDGVFSMDGDIAPLVEMAELAQSKKAWLMVDDAHGFGTLGDTGAGSCEYLELDSNEVPILMGTFSKALGSFGAFVAGSESLIEYLRQFARTYMFSTALPPLLAEASLTSIALCREESWRRDKLQQLILHLRVRASELKLPLMPSLTAIQPLMIGDNQKVMTLQAALKKRGILVAAIRPPTVPANTARLRISLNAHHTHEQVDLLVESLADCMKENKILLSELADTL
jgi:8-amino-7-oxononanoate synthase